LFAKKEVVKVGIFHFPPAVFQDSNGNADGYWPSLIRKIAERENWEIKFIHGSWSDGLNQIRYGKLDLITCVGYSPERSLFMDYSKEEAMTLWGQLYVRPNSKIKTLLDIEDKKIGVMGSDINGKNFKDLMNKFKIPYQEISFRTYPEALNALNANQLDGVITNSIYGYFYEHKYKVQRSSVIFSPFSLHFTSPKGKYNKHLKIIDHHLSQAKADTNSFYYKLMQKWLTAHVETNGSLPPWVKYVVSALILLILASAFWSWSLKSLVSKRTKDLELAYIKLSESESLFRSYFELGLVGMFICDKELKIIRYNEKLTKMLHDELLPVHDKSIFSLFRGSQLEKVENIIKDFKSGSMDKILYDTCFIGKEKKCFHVGLTLRCIRDSSGCITNIVALCMDLNERIQAEQEKTKILQALDRKASELEEIIYAASHDFRSPLVNLQGFCHELTECLNDMSNILESDETDKEQKIRKLIQQDTSTALEFIKTSATRFSELIEGLLSISRCGRHQLQLESIDTFSLATFLVENLKFQIKQKGIEVIIKKDMPNCWGDQSQIAQVFQNLIDNAVKFIPENKGGRIVISGEQTNQWNEYHFLDNGIGIEPRHHKKIFQIFHRLHLKKDMDGEGLGLSIVRRVVENHGGEIELKNPKNGGCEFIIRIPKSKDAILKQSTQNDKIYIAKD
jgi:PAS domain S-box-containing protein